MAQIALERIGYWSGKDGLLFFFGPNYFAKGAYCQSVQKAKAQIGQNTILKRNSLGGYKNKVGPDSLGKDWLLEW